MYLLDANIFIEAKRRYYGFDVCPGFWSWLDQARAAGTVRSVSQVASELLGANDDLSDWIKDREAQMFLEPTQHSLAAFAQVSQWVTGAGYTPSAINDFLSKADSYLVATALSAKHVVVTAEKPENSKNRVKIPNACVAFGVQYMNIFEMLRREKVRFVLERAA